MKPVFADTFYFLGYLNRNDQNRPEVMEAAERMDGPIVTTAWVLTEVADAFAASSIRAQIANFIKSLESDSNTRVVPASESLFRRGLAFYDARPDKDWSLTDCISFVVMEEESISEALTGDHHFVQAGFTASFI